MFCIVWEQQGRPEEAHRSSTGILMQHCCTHLPWGKEEEHGWELQASMPQWAEGFWDCGQQIEPPINANVFQNSFGLCWNQFHFSLRSDSKPMTSLMGIFCAFLHSTNLFYMFFWQSYFLKIWAQIKLDGRNCSLLACSETIMRKPGYEELWGRTKAAKFPQCM